MKILQVILSPRIGGAESLVGELAAYWSRAGHTVDVVALDPPASVESGLVAQGRLGVNIPIVRFRSCSKRRPLQQVARLSGLSIWLRKHRYDVAQAHAFQPNMYLRAAAALTNAKMPTVVTLHTASLEDLDYESRYARGAERALLHKTDAVVAVSEEAANRYRELFSTSTVKVVTIPNGVSDKYIAGSPRKPRSPNVFVAASRISPQKDLETMLQGFDEFRQSSAYPCTLRIVGPFTDPAYDKRLRELCRQLEFGSDVEFTGPSAQVEVELANSDVFVHSAIRENHPMSILEAAAMELPIVSSDLQAIRRCLGSDAQYFAPGDPKGLSLALSQLVATWPAAAIRARSVSRRVLADYSLRACAEAYLSLFDTVRGNKGRL